MRFKDLDINQVFEFEMEEKFSSLMRGPWIRISARKYVHDSNRSIVYTVGTINVSVIPGLKQE